MKRAHIRCFCVEASRGGIHLVNPVSLAADQEIAVRREDNTVSTRCSGDIRDAAQIKCGPVIVDTDLVDVLRSGEGRKVKRPGYWICTQQTCTSDNNTQ